MPRRLRASRMSAKAEGGYAKIEDADAKMHDGSGASVAADAAASITQDAFTQSIVMGANIQFNSVTVNVAGHDVDPHAPRTATSSPDLGTRPAPAGRVFPSLSVSVCGPVPLCVQVGWGHATRRQEKLLFALRRLSAPPSHRAALPTDIDDFHGRHKADDDPDGPPPPLEFAVEPDDLAVGRSPLPAELPPDPWDGHDLLPMCARWRPSSRALPTLPTKPLPHDPVTYVHGGGAGSSPSLGKKTIIFTSSRTSRSTTRMRATRSTPSGSPRSTCCATTMSSPRCMETTRSSPMRPRERGLAGA